MPVFNAERYVGQAIESILTQEFEDFEFLIFNDGSVDRSLDVISSFHDPRIRCFHSSENQGYVVHLNQGLVLARGKLIARMDADDISSPNRLAKQIDFLNRHPNYGIVGSWATNIDSNGRKLGLEKRPIDDAAIKWHQYLFYNPIIHPTVLVKKELFTTGGGYKPEFLYSEDYELWSRLFSLTSVANIPEPLLQYRKHSTSVCNTKQERQRDLVLHIMAVQVAQLLNRKIDPSSLKGLWNCSFTKAPVSPLSLHYEMQEAYCRKNYLSNMDRKKIYAISAQRLLAMAKHSTPKGLGLCSFFLRAVKLSPIACLQAVWNEGKKLIPNQDGVESP